MDDNCHSDSIVPEAYPTEVPDHNLSYFGNNGFPVSPFIPVLPCQQAAGQQSQIQNFNYDAPYGNAATNRLMRAPVGFIPGPPASFPQHVRKVNKQRSKHVPRTKVPKAGKHFEKLIHGVREAHNLSRDDILACVNFANKTYLHLPEDFGAKAGRKHPANLKPKSLKEFIKQVSVGIHSSSVPVLHFESRTTEGFGADPTSHEGLSDDIKDQVVEKYSKLQPVGNCSGKLEEEKGSNTYKCPLGSKWSSETYSEWKRHLLRHWPQEVWVCPQHYSRHGKAQDGVLVREDTAKNHFLKGAKHANDRLNGKVAEELIEEFIKKRRIPITSSEFPRFCIFQECHFAPITMEDLLAHLGEHFKKRDNGTWRPWQAERFGDEEEEEEEEEENSDCSSESSSKTSNHGGPDDDPSGASGGGSNLIQSRDRHVGGGNSSGGATSSDYLQYLGSQYAGIGDSFNISTKDVNKATTSKIEERHRAPVPLKEETPSLSLRILVHSPKSTSSFSVLFSNCTIEEQHAETEVLSGFDTSSISEMATPLQLASNMNSLKKGSSSSRNKEKNWTLVAAALNLRQIGAAFDGGGKISPPPHQRCFRGDPSYYIDTLLTPYLAKRHASPSWNEHESSLKYLATVLANDLHWKSLTNSLWRVGTSSSLQAYLESDPSEEPLSGRLVSSSLQNPTGSLFGL